MAQTLILQGITTDQLLNSIADIVAEKLQLSIADAYRQKLEQDIPELNTEQAAHLLGCSPSHLKNALLLRYPEYLQPTIKGTQTIRFQTAQVLKLKQKLETEKRRKPALSK